MASPSTAPRLARLGALMASRAMAPLPHQQGASAWRMFSTGAEQQAAKAVPVQAQAEAEATKKIGVSSRAL